jgi:prepilin-type N-terminal cleavage/methylation domain-containing protein
MFRLDRHDDGFTLVELLVAIVIGGVIATAIGAGISAGLGSTSTTQLRLSESHDAEFSARWFSGDAASTDLTHFSTSATHALRCTDGVPGATNVVTFGWVPTGGPDTTYEWVVRGSELLRIACVGGNYSGELTMVRNVSATTSPSVTCKPTCTSPVASVSLTVTTAADPRYPTDPPYSFTLSGSLRSTSATAPGSSSSPSLAPIVLLGAGTGSACGDPCDMLVTGRAEVNLNGNITVARSGSCTVDGHRAHCPTYVVDPNAPDPYAALPVPTAGPTHSDGHDHGCGVYTTTLVITGNDTLNPGGQDGCVYILEKGMSVTGHAIVGTSSAGVLLYIAGAIPSSNIAFQCAGSAQCELTPISDTASPYQSVSIFASRDLKPTGWPSNTYLLDVEGTDKSFIKGIVYAPVETVRVGGTGDLTVQGVVSLNMIADGTGVGGLG